MKKFTKLSAVGLSVIGGFLWATTPVFAIDLCPENVTNKKLCTFSDVGVLLNTVLNALLFVAFIAALIYLIFGGIRWIISGGDKEATAKAKGTVTSALIGLAIVLAAWILINIILNFFGIGNISGVSLFSIFGQNLTPGSTKVVP